METHDSGETLGNNYSGMKVYTSEPGEEARIEREKRLGPVISKMRWSAYEAIEESIRRRRVMRKAVQYVRDHRKY